jgi:hypothetical protein
MAVHNDPNCQYTFDADFIKHNGILYERHNRSSACLALAIRLLDNICNMSDFCLWSMAHHDAVLVVQNQPPGQALRE